jgi:adenylate cyclase
MIGCEGRVDYAAVGPMTEARLSPVDAAQDGQILVSQRVCAAVENVVAAKPRGEYTLKGLRHPVLAFNVAARHGSE